MKPIRNLDSLGWGRGGNVNFGGVTVMESWTMHDDDKQLSEDWRFFVCGEENCWNGSR